MIVPSLSCCRTAVYRALSSCVDFNPCLGSGIRQGFRIRRFWWLQFQRPTESLRGFRYTHVLLHFSSISKIPRTAGARIGPSLDQEQPDIAESLRGFRSTHFLFDQSERYHL